MGMVILKHFLLIFFSHEREWLVKKKKRIKNIHPLNYVPSPNYKIRKNIQSGSPERRRYSLRAERRKITVAVGTGSLRPRSSFPKLIRGKLLQPKPTLL